jgi:hypothetical protein
MKDLDALLPRVLEKAAACPEPTALRHIRDAAIEFCRRTRVWRETGHDFDTGTDGCEVIAVEPHATIHEITRAAFALPLEEDDEEDAVPSTIELVPVTVDWLDDTHPGWRDEVGTPAYVTQFGTGTVRIVPKPSEAGTLKLDLLLVPSQIADHLPDVLVDTYPKEIADGAIGSLLLLPNTEFGNAHVGAYHKGEFEKALGRFGNLAPRGQQRARRRTRNSGYF